jgi:type IV pilus assembly protein PilY1
MQEVDMQSNIGCLKEEKNNNSVTLIPAALPSPGYWSIGGRPAAKILTMAMLVAVSPNSFALALSEYPLFIGSVFKANVLLILDNSNSMDEEPSGAAAACSAVGQCGSASDLSKSQIARSAAKSLITKYTDKINLGLMAYQQSNVVARQLHNSPYDLSFDPTNYDAAFNGARNSVTKKYRITNVTDPGNFVHYNVALPFYSNANQGNAFCYSPTANPFDAAAVDTYRCFSKKTGISDILPAWGNAADEAAKGYQNYFGQYNFLPTDSDIAQGIVDFGKKMAWNHVGPTWFSNASPGLGYLHIPIVNLDAAQVTKLNKKLDRSQFVDNKPTDANYPLQNAGLTPLEGTLITAREYFLGNLQAAQGGPKAAPPQSCGKNFSVLLTDGLPSTNKNGALIANPAAALADTAAAAAALKASAATVETYVIGFALPYGTDPASLDAIADAGGTDVAYSASNLANLNNVLDDIFSDILDKTGAASSVATNSTNLKNESRVFQAKFAAADWSGQLLQYKLNDLANAEWDTGVRINAQAANDRVIITRGIEGGVFKGVPFRWDLAAATPTYMTGSQQSDLNKNVLGVIDGLGVSRVAYLRGDATTEVKNGGAFRDRNTSKLGDIVNSNPWYVGAPSAGYSDADHPGYTAFRKSLLLRKPVVYVGSNDGMLHGVDASLDFAVVAAGDPPDDAGNEILGYIPSMVFPNLSKLTSTSYNQGLNHKYLVDGSPMSADAYLNGAWRTTLLGALGAGGKGIYALDVTDPSQFAEANAADILLWEFTADDEPDDIGYIFNAPPAFATGQAKQIVKMANGKWAAIYGNGYNSNNGKAVLYILFIEDGMDGTWDAGDFVKITADAPALKNNGLSTPVPFDTNGDGFIDTVYAGDLRGNMWKFFVGPNAGDPTVTNVAGTWKLALSAAGCTDNCTPLFSAKDALDNPQPIIWPAEVTLHPAGGTVVLFGTGKYLEAADNGNNAAQTFYGIYDNGAAVPGRVNLTPQVISTAVVAGVTYRNVTKGCGVAPLPACQAAPKGWYADLPTLGERTTGVPKLHSGTIFFNTFIPSSGECASGGTGWLMAMDYLVGGLPNGAIFDTNADLKVDKADAVVSGKQIGGALGGSTLIKSSVPGEPGAAVSSLITGQLVSDVINLDPNSRGRISWREILQ